MNVLKYELSTFFEIVVQTVCNLNIVCLFWALYVPSCDPLLSHFGPRVYPMGSLVMTLVRPSMYVSVRLCVCPSVFKYLTNC